MANPARASLVYQITPEGAKSRIDSDCGQLATFLHGLPVHDAAHAEVRDLLRLARAEAKQLHPGNPLYVPTKAAADQHDRMAAQFDRLRADALESGLLTMDVVSADPKAFVNYTDGKDARAKSPAEECLSCLTNLRVAANTGCGHKLFCKGCAPTIHLDLCPICRREMKSLIVVIE